MWFTGTRTATWQSHLPCKLSSDPHATHSNPVGIMVHIIGKALLSITATLPIASCTGFCTPLEHLVGHEHPLVSVPANVGARVMSVVGIPIAIAAMPVTAHPALIGDCSLAPLTPIFVVAQTGAIALGGVPWLFIDLPVRLFWADRPQPPRPASGAGSPGSDTAAAATSGG